MIALITRNAHFIRDLELVNNPLVAKVLATLETGGGGGGRLRSLVASFGPADMPPPLSGTAIPAGQVLRPPESSLMPPTSVEAQLGEELGNIQLLVELMRVNQNLRSVSADESCFQYKDGTDAFLLFIASCPSISLERLELRFCKQRPRPTPPRDKSTPSNHRSPMLSGLSMPVFKALKELVLSGGNRFINSARLAFLCRCPNLERIKVENTGIDSLRLLSVGLRTNCPHLSRLELQGPFRGRDEDISSLLAAARSNWKELSLPDMGEFNLLSLGVLMRSVETRLEVLKVKGWGQLMGCHFLALLCSAKNLRRLEGPADGEVRLVTTELTMWAYAAFHQHTQGKDRSWALGPLMEYLQIWIDDVPRPDLVCRRNGDPIIPILKIPEGPGDEHLRYDVQRWVYTQLSRLTGLQELILGVKELDPKELLARNLSHLSHDPILLEESLRYVAPTFIYRSLEFSLESGLELLAGMKELRVLDVKSMAHRIGVAELEWMHVNWPKLKTIKGLISMREWLGDAEAGLEVVAAVEKWMDAHPHGIGSSFYSGTNK